MLLNALLLALRAIRRNLMRSFLTVLGIVIGVAAVITMVTLGNGATRMVSDQISSLGSNLLILRPGQNLGPGRDSAGAPAFKLADVEAIENQVPSLKAVAPVVGSKVTLVAGAQNWQSTVNGTSNAYFTAGNWKIDAGRQFDARLTELLKDAGIQITYPLILWRDRDGFLKACGCADSWLARISS